MARSIEIASLKECVVKTIALEVDRKGNDNGLIDTNAEYTLFMHKVNENDAFVKEMEKLSSSQGVSKVLEKCDSIYQAKNSSNGASIRADEEQKYKNHQSREELEYKIQKNNEKLEEYVSRLSQKEISKRDYRYDILHESDDKKMAIATAIAWVLGSAAACVILGLTRNRTSLISHFIEKLQFIGVLGAAPAAAVAIEMALYNTIKYKSKMTPEKQEKIRNDYKEAYLKVSQENEQLKAQLAELQK